MTELAPTAAGRLEILWPELGVRLAGDPVLVESHSNDVWLLDLTEASPAVLRVCWRGDRERLIAECVLGGELPPEIGYPEVLRYGRIESPALSWALTRRLTGTTLAEAWPRLSERERREACRHAATMMRALHGWRPPPEVVAALLSHQRLDRTDAMQIIGGRINPLPLPDLGPVAEAAAGVPGVDRGLVTAVVGWLEGHSALLPHFDDPSGVVLHADLHLSNIWWDGSAASALLDFEFARLGPAWADLARICDSVDSDRVDGIVGRHQLLWESLAEDYPEVFSVSDLSERITACRLAFELRQLLLWGPLSKTSPADHPQLVLRGLLNSR